MKIFTHVNYFLFKCRSFFGGWRDGRTVDGNSRLEELREHGYVLIPDFISSATADQWCEELLRIYADKSRDIVSVASNGADSRIFGVDRVSDKFDFFSKNFEIEKLFSEYVGAPVESSFTMSGRILAAVDNLGSGDGWHRDSFQIQVKSFLFLTDVTIDNGPLQVIPGTHNLSSIRRMISLGLMGWKQHRYEDKSINQYLAATNSKVQPLICSKGTLALVDTRILHRGRALDSGERVALTNYLFMRGAEARRKAKYFRDVLKVDA